MSTVAVDPRIRARRASVARDAGRRRLHRLLFVVGASAVGAALVGLTWTPLLDVESVRVGGNGRTSEAEVLEAAGVAVGDPLAWFDTSDAARAVARLPWVDEARVERTWSGDVRIDVTERVAVATQALDDDWVLLDGSGRVLEQGADQPAELPLVDGADGPALAVAAAVPPVLRPRIEGVAGTGDEVVVTLRDGGSVELGGTDEAAAKLAAAAAVLANVGDGCVDHLDVSVASAPALVRVPGCV